MKRNITRLICLVIYIVLSGLSVAQVADISDVTKEVEKQRQKLLSASFEERKQAVLFLKQRKKGDLNEVVYQTSANLIEKEVSRRKEIREAISKGKLSKIPNTTANYFIDKQYDIMYYRSHQGA